MTKTWIVLAGLALPMVAQACSGDSAQTDGGTDATTDTGKADAPIVDSASDVSSNDAAADVTDGGVGGHAYVTSFQTTPGLLVYTLPLSAQSLPSVVLTSGLQGPTDVELAGNQLAVIDRAALKVLFFDLPITQNSVAAISFTLDFTADDSAFDGQGNLWVAGLGGTIEEFTTPFSNASVKALTLTIPTGNCFAIQFDAAGKLYAGSYASNGIYVYSPPITGASTPALNNPLGGAGPTGFAIHGTKLYASLFQAGTLLALDLPLTADAGGTQVGVNTSSPERLAFNGTDLGLADHTTGVHVFAAPAFTTEVVALPKNVDAGLGDPRGILFGP